MAGKLGQIGQSRPNEDGGIAIPAFRLDLGIRIKSVLDRFSSRKEASKVAGVTTEQLANYVAGRAKPSFEVLVRLAGNQAISLEWLATGEGPMERDAVYAPEARSAGRLHEEAGPQFKPFVNLDRDLLSDMVVAVEEVLAERGFTLAPARKGELIATLYEMEAEEEQGHQAAATKRNVTRLLRLVS